MTAQFQNISCCGTVTVLEHKSKMPSCKAKFCTVKRGKGISCFAIPDPTKKSTLWKVDTQFGDKKSRYENIYILIKKGKLFVKGTLNLIVSKETRRYFDNE